jgi:hypothetical protein
VSLTVEQSFTMLQISPILLVIILYLMSIKYGAAQPRRAAHTR